MIWKIFSTYISNNGNNNAAILLKYLASLLLLLWAMTYMFSLFKVNNDYCSIYICFYAKAAETKFNTFTSPA